jgi:threonine dehydratase
MVTPNELQPDLAKTLEIENLYFKREDLHPLGSHKGRSIPIMIDEYLAQGITHFAISSSGNAALAAALYAKGKKIQLDILVGQKISTEKLERLRSLENENIKVTAHDRPVQTLFNITKDPEVKALRQSTDDISLIGYSELAQELLEIKDLKAVFIGTSSGTTAQALGEYFRSNKKEIEIHIIQTSSCHPMIDDVSIDELSIADAIVDTSALRREKVLKLISGSWIANNEQIKSAREITEKYTNLDISTNSALSVAGLMQAVYTGKKWNGSVVCMICGN